MIDREAEIREWLDYRGLPADTTLKELIEHEREAAAHDALAAYGRAKSAVIPVRAISDTWSSHLGNACFAVGVPRLREGDQIAVSFHENGNVWHGRVLGVRPGVGGEMWIDAAPVVAASDGTAPGSARIGRWSPQEAELVPEGTPGPSGVGSCGFPGGSVNLIEHPFTLRSEDPEFCGRIVYAILRYDRTCPYEVELDFGDGCVWTFARNLLAVGLREPAGIGDVRVWPERIGMATASVMIRFTSPDVTRLFEAHYWAVREFVDRIYGLVPKGSEPDWLDVDAGIARILAGETR